MSQSSTVKPSIAYPAWLKHHKSKIGDRLSELGNAVFGVNDADETIKEFGKLFKKIGSPIRLEDVGIDVSKKDEILARMIKNKVNGMHHKLESKDIEGILELMYVS